MLLLSSCAKAPVKPPPPGAGVYPYGIYQHRVSIRVKQPAKDFDMKGVVSYKPDRLSVVGLSAFGTTVFRITEDFKTGKIEKEFYLEIMKQNSERFEYFYALIRELLIAPKGADTFEKRGAKFRLTKPDELGIPRRAEIEHPQFDLEIQVTGYEF